MQEVVDKKKKGFRCEKIQYKNMHTLRSLMQFNQPNFSDIDKEKWVEVVIHNKQH